MIRFSVCVCVIFAGAFVPLPPTAILPDGVGFVIF